jgi:hypothetical protein
LENKTVKEVILELVFMVLKVSVSSSGESAEFRNISGISEGKFHMWVNIVQNPRVLQKNECRLRL